MHSIGVLIFQNSERRFSETNQREVYGEDCNKIIIYSYGINMFPYINNTSMF